mmetsp:Transcript_47538/g.135699  ORF Transcript_47538/g.135699 Transcript_47538/m.135699 type:complete len:221 (-) Transcript_47538:47-709(-)
MRKVRAKVRFRGLDSSNWLRTVSNIDRVTRKLSNRFHGASSLAWKKSLPSAASRISSSTAKKMPKEISIHLQAWSTLWVSSTSVFSVSCAWKPMKMAFTRIMPEQRARNCALKAMRFRTGTLGFSGSSMFTVPVLESSLPFFFPFFCVFGGLELICALSAPYRRFMGSRKNLYFTLLSEEPADDLSAEDPALGLPAATVIQRLGFSGASAAGAVGSSQAE